MHDSKLNIAEMHRIAAHAHLAAAEEHGRGDHFSGHEAARVAMVHSARAFEITQMMNRTSDKRNRRSRPGPVAWPGSLKAAAVTACAIQS